MWSYNGRHHRKGPIDGVGDTVKNVIFRKVKSGKVVVYTPFKFYETATRFIPESELLTEPDNMDSESKIIDKTLQIHKVERCQMKGVYYLKFCF